MTVVDLISLLGTVQMNVSPNVPVLNYNLSAVSCSFFNRDNLVQVIMSLHQEDTGATVNNFSNATGKLNANIDIGTAEYINLDFGIAETSPNVVIRALPR